jgi:hypothetical protein
MFFYQKAISYQLLAISPFIEKLIAPEEALLFSNVKTN